MKKKIQSGDKHFLKTKKKIVPTQFFFSFDKSFLHKYRCEAMQINATKPQNLIYISSIDIKNKFQNKLSKASDLLTHPKFSCVFVYVNVYASQKQYVGENEI